MKKRSVTMSVVGLLLIAGLATNSASGVVWNTPKTISGDLDVSLTGTLDRAYNFTDNGSAPTVNGVTFSNFSAQASDATDMYVYTSGYGSGSTPFSGLSSGYQTLLQSAVYAPTTAPVVMTFYGLAAGAPYQIQLWVNDSRDVGTSPTETISESGLPSSLLTYNTSASQGGLGQYVIGTFTASESTIQRFYFTSVTGARAQVNALQLRIVPIPEPSALVLLGGSLGGLLVSARRKRK